MTSRQPPVQSSIQPDNRPASPWPRCELVVGGQKSGKSRQAEARARAWLSADPKHRAAWVVTAQAHDEEMRARIAHHQASRQAQGLPLAVWEAARDLPKVLAARSAAHTLLVVDCLTLWLSVWLFPAPAAGCAPATLEQAQAAVDVLLQQLLLLPGPVVLVGNEIGQGVVPMGAEVRAFVDVHGLMHQRLAAHSERVTWIVAGLPVVVKGDA